MTLLSSSTFSMKLINQWGIIEKWKEDILLKVLHL